MKKIKQISFDVCIYFCLATKNNSARKGQQKKYLLCFYPENICHSENPRALGFRNYYYYILLKTYNR